MRLPLAALLSVLAVLPVAAQDQPKERPVKVTGDFGFLTASGNSEVTTLSLGERVTWKPDGSKFSFGEYAKYVYGKTDGEKTADQLTAGGRVDYALSPRLSLFGGLDYDRDPFAGIARRFTEPVGLSWHALDAARNKLTLEGGAAFTQVRYTEQQDDGEFDAQYASARAAGTYKWLFSEKGFFQLFGEYLPGLEEGIGYRVNSEASVVAPVAGILALKVSYLMRYNSEPPAGFKNTDRTFTTGLQVAF